MKRIAPLLILILLFTGCRVEDLWLTSFDTMDYIEAPKPQAPVISGAWRRVEMKSLSDSETTESEPKHETEWLLIDASRASAFGQTVTEPNYKAKMVNATSYSILKFKRNPQEIGLNEEELKIVTVEGEDRFYLELMEVAPDRILTVKEGYLYTYERVDSEITPALWDQVFALAPRIPTNGEQTVASTDTALLLGIRSTRNGNSLVNEHTYKTIFVRMPPEGEVTVLATEDLFVPRKSDFWTVTVHRDDEEGRIVNRVMASPYVTGAEAGSSAAELTDSVARSIVYVDDSMISTDSIYSPEAPYSQYETFTYENLAAGQRTDITLLAGESGRTAIISGGQKAADLLKNEYPGLDVRIPLLDEWGIIRRNGKWLFRSVVRATLLETRLQKGYDLYLLPTTRVFQNNDLAVPWETVRAMHPSAVDAVTSPAGDWIVIQEAFRFYVYRLNHGVIAEEPLQIVRIRSNDRIVMAEWATGQKTSEWFEIFQTKSLLEVAP